MLGQFRSCSVRLGQVKNSLVKARAGYDNLGQFMTFYIRLYQDTSC